MVPDPVQFLDSLPDWQATLLVVVVSLAAATLVEVVGVRIVRRLVSRTDSKFDNIVFQEVRWPAVISVALGGVYVLTQTNFDIGVVGDEQLDTFFGNPVLSVLVLLWAWALNRIVNRFVTDIKSTSRRFEFAPVFSNVFTLTVLVGTAFVILSIWGIEITPLLGAAGVAGIAVGFAAKDTVANFFGGLALYFDDTYKIGDYVVLDSGEEGTVVGVGVRSTTLMTRDEVLVTVPNSVLNNARITNQSAPETRKRIRVPIGVAYGTDVDEFEDILLEIAADETRVLDSPTPRARFRRFGDSALQYELLCWVRSPMDDRKAKHRLNRRIYQALGAADIDIPYPKRDVSFQSSSGGETPDPVNEVDSPTARDTSSESGE